MNGWLKRQEWTLIGVVTVLAFVPGVDGMRLQLAAQVAEATWADAVYFSLRLFTFEYDFGGEGGPVRRSRLAATRGGRRHTA